jgi:hypothetical protein
LGQQLTNFVPMPATALAVAAYASAVVGWFAAKRAILSSK